MEVSLTSDPGQIMVQGLLAHTFGQMKDKKVTGNSLNGFTKGKSCLTNQIAFCYKTSFVGETRKTGLGKAVDVTYFKSSKASASIKNELGCYNLEGWNTK